MQILNKQNLFSAFLGLLAAGCAFAEISVYSIKNPQNDKSLSDTFINTNNIKSEQLKTALKMLAEQSKFVYPEEQFVESSYEAYKACSADNVYVEFQSIINEILAAQDDLLLADENTTAIELLPALSNLYIALQKINNAGNYLSPVFASEEVQLVQGDTTINSTMDELWQGGIIAPYKKYVKNNSYLQKNKILDFDKYDWTRGFDRAVLYSYMFKVLGDTCDVSTETASQYYLSDSNVLLSDLQESYRRQLNGLFTTVDSVIANPLSKRDYNDDFGDNNYGYGYDDDEDNYGFGDDSYGFGDDSYGFGDDSYGYRGDNNDVDFLSNEGYPSGMGRSSNSGRIVFIPQTPDDSYFEHPRQSNPSFPPVIIRLSDDDVRDRGSVPASFGNDDDFLPGPHSTVYHRHSSSTSATSTSSIATIFVNADELSTSATATATKSNIAASTPMKTKMASISEEEADLLNKNIHQKPAITNSNGNVIHIGDMTSPATPATPAKTTGSSSSSTQAATTSSSKSSSTTDSSATESAASKVKADSVEPSTGYGSAAGYGTTNPYGSSVASDPYNAAVNGYGSTGAGLGASGTGASGEGFAANTLGVSADSTEAASAPAAAAAMAPVAESAAAPAVAAAAPAAAAPVAASAPAAAAAVAAPAAGATTAASASTSYVANPDAGNDTRTLPPATTATDLPERSAMPTDAKQSKKSSGSKSNLDSPLDEEDSADSKEDNSSGSMRMRVPAAIGTLFLAAAAALLV